MTRKLIILAGVIGAGFLAVRFLARRRGEVVYEMPPLYVGPGSMVAPAPTTAALVAELEDELE